MSDIVDVEVKETGEEQPPKPKVNEIAYNPIFPTLTLSVITDFPVEDMASDVYKIASDTKNFMGGYTTLGVDAQALDRITKGKDLQGAIYQIALQFMRENKAEFNADKCAIRTWINVVRKDGFVPQVPAFQAQLTGMFFIQCSKETSPLILHNPTTPFRLHEHQPARPEDYTAFTAPSAVIQPEQGTIFMWPAWIRSEIPPMMVGGPLIYVGFTVDYLPAGA